MEQQRLGSGRRATTFDPLRSTMVVEGRPVQVETCIFITTSAYSCFFLLYPPTFQLMGKRAQSCKGFVFASSLCFQCLTDRSWS